MASFEENVNKAGERYRTGETGMLGLAGDVASAGVNSLFQWDRAKERIAENNRLAREGLYDYPRVEQFVGNAGALLEAANAPIEHIFRGYDSFVAPVIETPAEGVLSRANPAFDMVQYAKNTGGEAFASFLEEHPTAARRFKDVSDAMMAFPMARGLLRSNKALRGFHEGSFDVIIDNFYDPRSKKFSPEIEGMLQKYSPDQKSATSAEVYTRDNKQQNKVRAALGMGIWAAKGIKRVAENLVNPYQRATYTEFGISPSYVAAYDEFMRIDKLVKEGKATAMQRRKALDTAHSQMQQLANIRAQANARAKGPEASDPFMLAVSDPNSNIFFEPNKIGKDWYAKTGNKGANISPVSAEDALTAQKHFEHTWLNGDTSNVKVVVKKPRGVGGDHFSDVVANNGRFKKALNVFEVTRGGQKVIREFDSVSDLEKALMRNSGKKIHKVEGKQEKEVAYTVFKTDDTGVWIKGSRAGTAKTEGGINMIMKVEPNGNITGYMSDLHDMFDKVPIVKDILNYTLPTKMLAVTPPMQSNVYSIMSEASTAKKGGQAALDRRVAQPSAVGAITEGEERIRRSGEYVPSKSEVARQSVDAGQNVNYMFNLANYGGETEGTSGVQNKGMFELPENYSRY